ADHHYSAYPNATVIDVRRCLHLHGELESFAKVSKGLSDEHFRQAFHRLLLRVQNDLGSVGASPAVPYVQAPPAPPVQASPVPPVQAPPATTASPPNRYDKHYGYTALFPIAGNEGSG